MKKSKRSAADVLRRWMALDAALNTGYAMSPSEFAKKHGVSVRTVRRDLATFRDLGQRMSWDQLEEDPKFYCRYARDQRCLFAMNLRERRRSDA
jgi:predicted DNA-binding transcriptional regulator YafY